MTINSYLTRLANASIIRDQEKDGIQRSLSTIQSRLHQYFRNDIDRDFVFGSYSRGTILPRNMDERSDIDYMVVFKNGEYQPQTYLNHLHRFVDTYYRRSEITQSNPTIVLSLNHIRFELVPAINHWFSGLQIPAKASDYQKWIETDPRGFNSDLTKANQSNSNLIKPLVRLIKYWNACNRYPYESYQLEKQIVGHGFWHIGLLGGSLQNYFFDFIDDLEETWGMAQWKREAITRAKRIIREAKAYERGDYLNSDTGASERKIKELLPPTMVIA